MGRNNYSTPILGLLLILASSGLGACTEMHITDPDASIDGSPDARPDARPDAPIDGGGTPGWASCTFSDNCVVQPASCCGLCGAATAEDMVGVNRDFLSEQRDEACGGGEACPGCAQQPDPDLVATCQVGVCVAESLRFHDARADCDTDDDCVLRTTTCCPTCGEADPSEIVAVNRERSYELTALFCDGADVNCAECVSTFPPTFHATCVAVGVGDGAPHRNYCRVSRRPSTGG